MEMPFSKTIEEDCLGGLLVCTYYVGLTNYEPVLTIDDFYIWRHKVIYQAMIELHKRGIEPHEVNVKAELKRSGKLTEIGGPEFIHHLAFCALTRPAQPNHPGQNRR